MRLENKIAVVTGAASGIGREIARTFAREGAKVVIADLDQEGAEAAAGAIGAGGGAAVAVAMDVADEAEVDAGFAKLAAWGGADVLVSNAGVQIVQPLDQFEFANWRRLLAIHLDGAFLTTRAALRQMYAQPCAPCAPPCRRSGSAAPICWCARTAPRRAAPRAS
jgi:3-hydroxybutyrate dehydrogenase